MIKQIKAVLFDLDGTLIDTAEDFLVSMNATRTENNLSQLTLDTVQDAVSNGAQGMLEIVFPDYSKAAIDLQKIAFLEKCAKNTGTFAKPFSGITQLIKHLDDQLIPWGIVTNRNETLTRPLLEKLQLKPSLDCVICPEQVTQPKPSPEGLLLAAEKFNVNPEACIYVGDHLRDIQAANQANMFSIAAAYGYIGKNTDINQWQADITVDSINTLQKFILNHI